MDLDTDLEDSSPCFAVGFLCIRRKVCGNHGITDRILRILSFHRQGHSDEAQVAPGHSGIPGFSQGAKGAHPLPRGNVTAWIYREAGKPSNLLEIQLSATPKEN